MSINIGIATLDRLAITEGLSRALADTYTLSLKTQNFHWNVTGPKFQTLHTLFETQYGELILAIDEIAERIRALGEPAPGSYAAFAELTQISEERGVPTVQQMLQQRLEGQEAVARTARGVLPIAADAGDEPSADLLTQRVQAHEKNAWMLRSLLAA